MKRSIIACVAGLVTWLVVVSLIDRVLRLTISNYTTAEQTLQFTLAMKWARLVMAILTSLTAGAVTRWISPSNRWPAWIVGAIVLAIFLPVHIAIWSKFPVWYHLTFLLTIVPACGIGLRPVHARGARRSALANPVEPAKNENAHSTGSEAVR